MILSGSSELAGHRWGTPGTALWHRTLGHWRQIPGVFWGGGGALSHPLNARLDRDQGNVEARLKPWALCQVPRAIPEWSLWSCWAQCPAEVGAVAMKGGFLCLGG